MPRKKIYNDRIVLIPVRENTRELLNKVRGNKTYNNFIVELLERFYRSKLGKI
jgi:hypothetical protein